MLDEAGPALLDAVRNAVQAHPDRRRQDRVTFDQPVEVRTAPEDGAPEMVLHARAETCRAAAWAWCCRSGRTRGAWHIFLSPGGDAPPVPVPSRLVRLQPREDGYEAGALFLGVED